MSDETTEIEVVTVEPGGNVVAVLDPALTGYIKGSGAGVFSGVASIPQSDLTLATDLAAVEGLAGTGIAVRTAANTWANRTLVAGTGISLTNADGVSGDITITATGTVTPDLTAIEALASQGIAVRTATNTWALRNLQGTANRTTITNGDGVLGDPTVDVSAAYVGQATITTVGTIATGTWAASFPNSGAVLSTGEMGVRVAPNTSRSLNISTPSSAGVTVFGSVATVVAPSTATTQGIGYYSSVSSAAAAFTVATLVHFYAGDSTKGAASTITNLYGFRADNAIAVGTSNFGFYSTINAATGTFQLYMAGTAQSFFNAPVGIQQSGPLTNSNALFAVGISVVNHPSTASSAVAVIVDTIVPSTVTSLLTGYQSVLRTAAAAFTLSSMEHFRAHSGALGAGSTITNVRGFYAANAIAIGTNNYGFYSDIAQATTTYQVYMGGTAQSVFVGPVGIGASAVDALNGQATWLLIGLQGAHPATLTGIFGVKLDYTAPATATTSTTGYDAILRTAASAFTCTSVNLFQARAVGLGAGSVITNVRGFYALNGIAVGTNNYGFYSDINIAATTWQIYMSGTAPSFFAGPVNILNAGGNNALITVGVNNTHPSTTTSVYGVFLQLVAPATATNTFFGYSTRLDSAASAFTINQIIHYFADTTAKGAGSTINNVYGFYASNNIAGAAGLTGATGFFSNINSATGVRQMNMSGTADCQFGGAVVMSAAPVVEARVVNTYSTSITMSASAGNAHSITATDGVAFTINAPTTARTGQYLELVIRNTSGGALGVITWNAVFKMTAFTNPATTFSRSIIFRYDGTNWVEVGRGAADVPN